MVRLPHQRRPWADTARGALLFLTALPVILIAIASLVTMCAYGAVPEKAQASSLAVPAQKDPKYASAIVVTQCRQAIAVLFVDKEGKVYPQHFKDLSFEQLLQKLTDAPADKVTEVSLACPADKSA